MVQNCETQGQRVTQANQPAMPVVVYSPACQKEQEGPIDGDRSTASMDGRAIVSGRGRGRQAATSETGG